MSMTKCRHGIEPCFDCALCIGENRWVLWVWLAIISLCIGFWVGLFAVFGGRIGL